MIDPYPNGPEFSYSFEMQRGVTRIVPKQLVVLIR